MKTIVKGLKYLFLSSIAFSVLYPLVWVLMSSIKSEKDFFTNPWGFPVSFHWETYASVLSEYGLHWNLLNSLLLATVTTMIVVLISTMAAYGIMRLKWKGNMAILGLFLLGIMIPGHATLIPLYINMQGLLSVLDPRLVLLIPYIAFGIPTSILILSGYFSTLSKEMEEAAVIDGCSLIGAFFKIILPISTPVLATVGILAFIHTWNELLFALVFLKQTELQTVPVAILKFVGFYSTDWSKVLATISITMLPSLAVYMFFQEKIVQGVMEGSVKS